MTKKVFLRLCAIVLFTCAITVGVNITLNGVNVNLNDITLSNIEILAQNEGGNTTDCPGGWCDWDDVFISCHACCPGGKNPKCSAFGCQCTNY